MLTSLGLGGLFAAAGNLYLLLALAGVCIALWKGKTRRHKLIFAVLVLALFIAPIAPEVYRQMEYSSKLAKAQALFDDRCKTAGERIYRTVENVEGVLLMKIRPKVDNFSDQFSMTDPYGHDFGGDAYIASFLWGRNKEGDVWEGSTRGGFPYVEVVDAATNIRYRYTAATRPRNDAGNTVDFLIEKEATVKERPSYGVIWQDLSTKNDREFWIAGGSIKVMDLKSGEVIGERIGYMMDAGQGNTDGGRSPWLFAQQNACPEFPTIGNTDPRRRRSGRINRSFIESILKPKQGE